MTETGPVPGQLATYVPLSRPPRDGHGGASYVFTPHNRRIAQLFSQARVLFSEPVGVEVTV